MNDYHLFSIPIYTVSEEDFNIKRKKRVISLEESLQEKNYPDTEKSKVMEGLLSLSRPKDVWLYNQIIGYIRVSLSWQDIHFELYMPLHRKRYKVSSGSKSFMENWQLNGYHFRTENLTNEQIIQEIREWINDISKKEKLKCRYIDRSVFENVANYIDFRALIDGMNGEEQVNG